MYHFDDTIMLVFLASSRIVLMKYEITTICLLLGIHWLTYGLIPIVNQGPVSINFRDHTLWTCLLCSLASTCLAFLGALGPVLFVLTSIAIALASILAIPMSLWKDRIILGLSATECKQIAEIALTKAKVKISDHSGTDLEIQNGLGVLRVRKWNTYHATLAFQEFVENPGLSEKIDQEISKELANTELGYNQILAWLSTAIGTGFLALIFMI